MTRIDPAAWAAFCNSPTAERFSPLYEQSKRLVWSLCRRILGDEEDALDAFQGVYARLLAEARERGRALATLGEEATSRLIYQNAVREANRLRMSRQRRSQREVVMEELPVTAAADPSAHEAAAQSQARTKVEALVATLPEKYRLPLELHYYHGLSQTEIARMMGKDKGTISRRIAGGLRLLEPLAERAGLGRAAVLLGVIAAGATLADPPSALAAGVVFTRIESLVATGAVAAGGGAGALAGLKLLLGSGLAKTAVIALSTLMLATMVTIGVARPELFSRLYARMTGSAVSKSTSANNRSASSASTSSNTAAEGAKSVKRKTMPVPRETPLPGAAVVGRVTAQQGGQPVAGVKISAQQDGVGAIIKETQTDANGTYKLYGLPKGQRLAIAVKSESHAWQSRLLEPAEGVAARCDFTLEPGGEVAVTVSDPAGRPLPGAQVFIDNNTIRDEGPSSRTDAAGRAVLRNVSPTRSVSVGCRVEGIEMAASQSVQFPRGQLRTNVTFTITPPGEQGVFSGLVTDPQGKPLPGITVNWGYIRADVTTQTTTGPDGRYRLTSKTLEPNKQLTVYAKGWATQFRQRLTPGRSSAPKVVDFSMQPAHWLAGIVVDDHGRPLAGIHIKPEGVTQDWGDFTPAQNVTTDATGRFRIENLPQNGFRLQVWNERRQYPTEYDEINSADRELRIELHPFGVILGRMVDKETRRPVKNFTLRYSSLEAGSDLSRTGQTFTSPEGRFKLEKIKQGERCDLTVEAPGYPSQVIKGLTGEKLEEAKGQVVELDRGKAQSGVLLDRDKGTPIEGAEILYCSLLDERVPFSWDNLNQDNRNVKILQKGVTGPDGIFNLSLNEKNGTIFIRPRQHQRLIIKSSEQKQYLKDGMIIVRLGAGASLSGKVIVDGAAKGDAYLNLIGQSGGLINNTNVESGHTSADGSFHFASLPPDEYTITVQCNQTPSYQCLNRRFTLAEGEQKTLNIGDDLGPLTLTGAVFDHGKPVPNIIIELTPQFDWDYTRVASHSGEKGDYAVRGLRPGSYKAKLREGLWEQRPNQPRLNLETTIQVATGQTRHDFEFKQGHSVTAQLAFAREVTPETRGSLSSAVLMSKDMMARLLSGQDNKSDIDMKKQGRIEGGRITFEGRFKGEYVLMLGFGQSRSRRSEIPVPGAFKLDNLAADQDLGEIPVAGTGQVKIRLKLNKKPGSEPPQYVFAMLTPTGQPTLQGISLQLDQNQSEQTVGPVGEGMYDLMIVAPGYASDPAVPVPVTIKPGAEAGPFAYTLRPDGVIMGGAVEKGHERDSGMSKFKPDRIILRGPSGQRTLVPQSIKDVERIKDRDAQTKDFAVGPVFRFQGLAEGHYTVTVEAAGYASATVEVEVTPGKMAQAPVMMTPLAKKP